MTEPTDNNDNKFQHHAKEAAKELSNQAKEAADKIGAQAKEQFEKFSPKAKEAAAKAKANPLTKVIAAVAAVVVLAVVAISLLPGGPNSTEVSEALRAQMREQASAMNGFVGFFGNKQYAEEQKRKAEAAIDDLSIDVEIVEKVEQKNGSWVINAYVTTTDANGNTDEGDQHFTMRKGKNGWRITH